MPAYIQIPDIEGESQKTGHEGWVYVESVSLPIFRSITPGATGVQRSNGETSLGDLIVSKTWDSSSPSLAAAVANGQYKDEVVVHLCSTINEEEVINLEIKLKDVILTGYSFHGTANMQPVPTEEVTMNYTGIEWTYKKFNTMGEEDGNFPASYDTQTAAS